MRACPFCGFNEGWTQDLREKRSDPPSFRVQCHVCKSMGPISQTTEGAKRKWDRYLKEVDPIDKGAWQYALEESSILVGKNMKDIKEYLIKKYSDLITKYGKKPGDIVEFYLDVVMQDDDYNDLTEKEWEDRYLKPFDLKLLHYKENSFQGWDGILIKGPIENVMGWMDSFYDTGETIEEKMDFYVFNITENVGAPMATLGNVPGMGNAAPASMAAMTGSQQASPNAIGSGDKWDSSTGPSVQEQNINPYDQIGTMMAKKMNVPMTFKKGKNQSVKHVEQIQADKISHKHKHKVSSYSDYANLIGKKKKTSKT